MKLTLKAMRVNAGLTQTQAAERIKVTKETLSRWERYQTLPKANQLINLCQIYGCSIDDIFLPEKLT